MTSRNPQAEVGGRMLTGNELAKYAKRRGLCHICLQHQTHRRVGLFRAKMEPLTVESNGSYTVYKGYCLQPTCYRLKQAKQLLGERVPRIPQTGLPGMVGSSSSSTPEQAPAASPQHLHNNHERPVRNERFGSPRGNNETRTDQLQHTPPRVEHGERDLPIPEEYARRSGRLRPRTTYLEAAPEPPSGDQVHFRASGRTAVSNGLQCSLNTGSSLTGVQRLECLAKDGSFVDFFCRFETDGTTSDVVIPAFRILQEQVVRHQAERPSGLVLSGGGWVKIIDDKITEFKADKAVVLEGLRALLTICELPYNYKIMLVRKGAVDVILFCMDEHSSDNDIIELACAIFNCLSKNPKDKLNATHPKAVSVLQRLVQVVLQPSSVPAKTMALSTLYNFSKQKICSSTTNKNLLHNLHQSIASVGGPFADSIGATLQSPDLSENDTNTILSLVWKVSCGHKDNRQGNPSLATEKLVDALVGTVRRFHSREIVESSCGAFANLPLKPSFSVMQTEIVVCAICDAAHIILGQDDQRLALCAVHALCNLLSDPARRDVAMRSYPQACRLVLALMEKFSDCEELLELGCAVVGHLCCDTQQNKEAIVSEGCFMAVVQAFQSMVATRESSSLEKKESVLTAILAWSECQLGAQQIIHERLLESIDMLLQIEADPSILNILEMISANCQQAQRARSSPAYGEILRQNPELFPVLMREADSERQATALLSALRESQAVERGILDQQAFDVLIGAMSNFRQSGEVQANVCAVLADSIQRGSAACRTICRFGLPVVTDALCRYESVGGLAENGCYVLLFILRYCDLRQLGSVRNGLARALVSVIAGQHGARAAMLSMSVFVECIGHDSYFLESGCHPNTIRLIATTMTNTYPESAELQRTGCGLLRILCSDNHTKEVIGREGGITAVMTSMMIHGQSPEVCAVALAAIRRLSMLPSNKALILQNGGIEAILDSVTPQTGNPDVVSGLFSALNNIVVEPDTRSAAEIGPGVVLLLADSMRRFPNDGQVQKNACFLLKSCSFRKSNLRLMHQYNPMLIPLLKRAAQSFPEDCRVIATGVINRLNAY